MSVVGPIAAKKLQGRECNEVFLLQQNSLVINQVGHTDGHQPFAERTLRNIRRGGSLRLDACELDHLGPLLGFVGDELAEVDRRERKHCAT